MAEIARALERLSTGRARARAASWARRRHVQLLLLAVLLAAVTRWVVPLPGLRALVGAAGPALGVALALLLAGLLLKRAAVPWLRQPPARIAAALDDQPGWKDRLGTALDVERRGVEGLLAGVLAAQAAGLLASVPLPPPPPRVRGRALPWGRLALAGTFVALLLLPGVSGRGPVKGAGRGGEIGLGHRERPASGPYDADQWLREHARLLLSPTDPTGTEEPTGLVARFHTLRPLPEDYAGELALVLDDLVVAPLGTWAETQGRVARLEQGFDLRQVRGLEGHLTPGPHRVRVRLAPTSGPWTVVLRSNEVELVVPPQDAGGGGGGDDAPDPQPEPQAPPPPQPVPTPAPTPGEPPPALPMPEPEREEAVSPIVNEGTKVKKDAAVVATRDPDAGLEPPKPRPLAEALREFERVLERAVGGERFSRRDQQLLQDYFRSLRRLAEPAPR